MTDDELLAFSRRNPGYQFERTGTGALVVSPTGTEGGRRSGEVFLQLGAWNRQVRTGVVFDSSTGFNLPDGSCLSPDASWVRRERWEALSPEAREGFAPLCPDAVFEVRSTSNSLAELRAKMHTYLENGAEVGILIDPDSRTVEVFRPQKEVRVVEDAETVSIGPELPGFALDLAPVFDA